MFMIQILTIWIYDHTYFEISVMFMVKNFWLEDHDARASAKYGQKILVG